MRGLGALFCLCVLPIYCQSNLGELRLKITDPSGLGVRASVHLSSAGSDYKAVLDTSSEGTLDVQRLPYGLYRVEVQQSKFAAVIQTVSVNSPLPLINTIHLHLRTASQTVMVNASATLMDPYLPGSVSHIGMGLIQNRLGSIPGRSLQDLIDSQPGWLYEGNAVLHPRGSEYQTQFVIDGIPLTDNRSPGSGPEISANGVQSMNVYTAGIPAEYGRKLGGVIEINTIQDTQPGFHGRAVFSGGSFGTANGFMESEYTWGRNTLGASANESRTGRYLNPVVPQNYSNSGMVGDFSVSGERDLTKRDRVNLVLRHELARYDIPNEYVQQQAGQRQTADNLESMGIASWQRIVSLGVLVNVRGMMRENANDFDSNPQSTPVAVFQHNWFREGYVNGSTTVDRSRHEFKFGIETDNTFLNEDFQYHITDPAWYNQQTPIDFSFKGNRPDLEQSAYAQDLLHERHWSISLGLRWDHYQLMLNQQAVEPRISIARFFPRADMMVHVSYDRVFQTPSSANILLSSSTAVESINPAKFLRIPVQPSRGNYYELGLNRAFSGRILLSANYFRRAMNNTADDKQIENTSISFPVSFRRSVVYGLEGRIYVPEWQGFSGFLSYSYEVGKVWFPVTGGLFLGDDAAAATATSGHFPDTQDQRNTARGRLRYQVEPRFWIAGGAQFNSGLPFDYAGSRQAALDEYGQAVLNRINFARGRIFPSATFNASAGVDVRESGPMRVSLQADGENLNDLLNVIDFNGLFSGNAIGPPRSYAVRITFNF